MKLSIVNSSLGQVLISTRCEKLFAVELGNNGTEMFLAFCEKHPRFSPNLQVNSDIIEVVLNAIDSGVVDCKQKLFLNGTAFQKKVWKYLRTIKSGAVTSYKEVAEAVGAPKAWRAVGAACGANPIAVIIPCHRVVRSDGKSGGYRWGTEIKNKLLDRER